MLNTPYDIIFDSTPQIILVVNADGKVIKFNSAANRQLKLDQKNFTTQDLGLEINPRDLKKCIKLSGELKTEVVIKNNYYKFLIKGNSSANCCYFFGDDITSLKARKNELIEQQDFLRKVIDTDPNLIFVKDKKGRFLLANEVVAKVYGTTPALMLGKTDADFNPNIDELEHFNKDDLYVINEKKPFFEREEVVTTAAGEQMWLETLKVPLEMPDGTVNVLGIAQNISRRKVLQSQLLQSQKMEAIGQLAGGVAHDFNNLLSAILGSAEMITLDIVDKNKVLNHARVIEKTASQAAMLSRKLLTFSRRGHSKPEPMDLHEAIEDSLIVIDRTIDKSITIVTDLVAENSCIKGDLTEIQQLILNLVINSRDALKEVQTEKQIKISTSNLSIDLSLSKELNLPVGEYLKFEVEDTGIGIAPDHISHIFEPFYSTKTEQNGTGLGLAVVYGIIESHLGLIQVESVPNQSTKFKVYLPITKSKKITVLNRPQVDSKGKKGTVLVIDDFPIILEVTSKLLKQSGYSYILSNSTAEAVEIYKKENSQIDYVILDIITPGMPAKECFTKLKEVNPEVKVILASGYAQNKDVKYLLANGAKSFMQKPYQLEDLVYNLTQS